MSRRHLLGVEILIFRLTVQPRLASELELRILLLQCELTGMCHHAHLSFFILNQIFLPYLKETRKAV
jgi:hypothetical protein